MFFADKCTPIQNNSVIPNFIECESMNRLISITFNDEIILKIIRVLDVNKAHDHDDISVRMIKKLCNKSIIPVIIIYKNCINSGIFPNIWKKSNIVPVHKKAISKSLTISLSLLQIFGKILERLIFNSLFKFLHENNLLNEN